MSVTREILEDVSDQTGVAWNEESMIAILCEYIDAPDSEDAFEDFLRERAKRELEG